MIADKTVSKPSGSYPGLPMPRNSADAFGGMGGPGAGPSPMPMGGGDGTGDVAAPDGAPSDMSDIFLEWAFGKVAEAQEKGNPQASEMIANGIKMIVQGMQTTGEDAGPLEGPPSGGGGVDSLLPGPQRPLDAGQSMLGMGSGSRPISPV